MWGRFSTEVLLRGYAAVALLSLAFSQPVAGQLEVAELGSCPLELGGRVEECRLAYQTYGRLNAAGSNAILIPTWFTGRAAAWESMLGPDGAVDTTSHYVVVVESLGAGASSSPVTSSVQPGLAFPEITIGDMVVASYRLATEHLGLDSLDAVVGVSMGAMQAFEWAVRYPEYVGRIVPIAGAPRQAPFQRAIWQLIADAAHEGASAGDPGDEVIDELAHLILLVLTSPEAVNTGDYAQQVAQQAEALRAAELLEWAWHARAILRFDVGRAHGGSLESATASWNRPTLIVVSEQDHSVSPEPALEFGRLVGAEVLVLPDPAGHLAFFSNAEAQAAVRRFLAGPDSPDAPVPDEAVKRNDAWRMLALQMDRLGGR